MTVSRGKGILFVPLFLLGSLFALWGCEPPADREASTRRESEHAGPPAAAAHAAGPGHQKMLRLLQEIKDRSAAENSYVGKASLRQSRKKLAALPVSASERDRWLAHIGVAEAELCLGNEAEAIKYFKKARRLAAREPPKMRNWTLYRQGVAYLRMGETQNCCQRHTPESCIVPIRGGGIHTRQEGSRQAISCFSDVLRDVANRDLIHLNCVWLLNVAYMTIGGYPDQVPPEYRIPPASFEADEAFPRFKNIAGELGLDTFDLCGGAIGDDFNNDGYLDIVVSTWDTSGQMRYFRNNRDGTFTDLTREAGLLGLYGGLNLVQADYDNDGNVDMLVLRGAWLHTGGRNPNSLLRNNGDGTFTDVTFDAGLGIVHYPTQTASWGDYDNDGDLDLYVGNETAEAYYAPFEMDFDKKSKDPLEAPCQLFRNNGDGTFTDVAEQARVRNMRYTKAVMWGDFDGDRWPDIYVSNFGVNRLYRNNGDGTFTDLAAKLNVTGPNFSFPSWFWDFNNDGHLDIFTSCYVADIADLAHSMGGGKAAAKKLGHLYRATGSGGFEEVAQQYNLVRPNIPMGANFGDLDNDGYLDFYLGTGGPNYQQLMPNLMYRNREGKSFADVTFAGGFGHLQKGHGVVFADLDNDGDQDVFEQMGGAYPGDRYSNVLYENPGFGNHWVTVQLEGVRSNRSAIGARIRVEITEDGKRRSIYKHVNSGGSFGANPLRQTIGLGKALRIELLEVYWPTSHSTQTFRGVAPDQCLRIVEGEDHYTPWRLEKLALGKKT